MEHKVFHPTGFQEGFEPDYRCPVCNSHLQVGQYTREESAGTRILQRELGEAFGAEHVEQFFRVDFKCSSSKCQQIVFCVGHVTIYEAHDLDEDGYRASYHEFHFPHSFTPHLNVFVIPEKTPKRVRACLNASFKLLFMSSGSALNEVRNALEFLMDDLGVNRKMIDTKGKEALLSLHARVTMMPPQYKGYEEQLLAVKGVGNWGSHAMETDRFDVLKAYDILSLVLDELYSGRKGRIDSISKELRSQKREIVPVKGTP